jgi:DNA-binding NarL/FixJ family response regulator
LGAITSAERTAVLHDPHWLWLDAIEHVLERVDIRVVGKATCNEECLELVAERQPDVLVTELSSPSAPMDLIAKARERHPEVRVIVLTSFEDSRRMAAAYAAGAMAYVLKTAREEDVGLAIRQAFESSIHFAPALPAAPGLVTAQLTRRELEILRLVAEGYTNAALSKMLWVTEQTVKFHLSNVYRKLNVANRTEASRWAQLHGLLPLKSAA